MIVRVGKTYNINKIEGCSLEISFSPPRSGSYELICCGNKKMEGIIYSGNDKEVLHSNYNNSMYTLKFAKTLLYQCVYIVKINIIEVKSVQTHLSLRIEDIQEPTNSLFKYQWGILNKSNGLDINILPLWKYIKESNVNIGIADTGINYNHCNLNGYINSDLAYNFVTETKDIKRKYGTEYEHGTHAAGIVAAQPCNNCGIYGITENSNIISLKIFGESNDSGIKVSDAFVSAVEYSLKHNIRIINCSFCGTTFSEKEKKIMEEAKDILFIIAAGNNSYNLDYKKVYPACYELENGIVVAAMDREGKMYPTSNYGQCIDIIAPGENIVSLYGDDKFIKANGTSVAAPFVTGVCSLMLACRQDLKPREIKKIITSRKNVTPIEGITNCVISGGLLNAYKSYVSLMENCE
ncbi:MAG: S8 family serine peptidase [Lachnospiraceae bacterium]|nr:S8 family serine peptidase [Lachnospiraceae bacterium]